MKEINTDKVLFKESLKIAIRELVGDDLRPVMIYSSAWPFLKELEASGIEAVNDLLSIVLEEIGSNRTILMPTFSRGFIDGVADLDQERSSTGVLTEVFRKKLNTLRTRSAFFPFNVIGPDAQELYSLSPKHSWGEGSVFEWCEKKDVIFLMLGTHPTHCSFLHRIEYLLKDKINYRYDKSFQGTLIRNGVKENFTEILYVRSLSPAVVNDFTVLLPLLYEAKMKVIKLNGISLASYTTLNLLNTVMPAMSLDPYLTVKNRQDYEEI